MTAKPFHIETTRSGSTLNGASLDGAEVEEVDLPDGTEAYMLLLPKKLVSTKLSLRSGRPVIDVLQAPVVKEIPAPVETGAVEEPEAVAVEPDDEPAPKQDKPKGEAKRKLGRPPKVAPVAEPIDPRTDIEVLKLTAPTAQRLLDNGVNNVGKLAAKTENDVLDMGLSRSTAALIRSALYKVGHSLTITEPKLSDICLVPVTRKRLNEEGIVTVDDLTKWTAEELRLIRGCNGTQVDKFIERLARYGKSLKAS